MRLKSTVLWAASVACLLGCHQKEKPVVGGLGNAVALGKARDLRVTADGSYLVYLVDAQKPLVKGVPPEMLLGTLQVVPASGGATQTLGRKVTNVSGGSLLSSDSRWMVYLTDFDVPTNTGKLHAWDFRGTESTPKLMGSNVSYFLLSPNSAQVAFVDAGLLKLASLLPGDAQDVAKEVSTVEFSKDSRWLFFKRKLDAGAGLWFVKTSGGAAQKIADQVGEYVVSNDSKYIAFQRRSPTERDTFDLFVAAAPSFVPRLVGRAASRFAFSPDSKWLLRTQGARLQAASDAMNFLGDLHMGLSAGGGERKLGSKVQDFFIAPDSKRIAFLQNYNLQLHQGRLAVDDLEKESHQDLSPKVRTLLWSPDGQWLAYQSVVSTEFGPSPDLYLLHLGDEKPRRLLPWVFGYGFDPKNGYLLARANCTRAGDKGAPRACDLMLKDLVNDTDQEPIRIVEGIYSFKTSEDGQRLLLSYARLDSDSYDAAFYDLKTKTLKTLDHRVHVPLQWVGKSGDWVAYAVADLSRAGVYTANINELIETKPQATKVP